MNFFLVLLIITLIARIVAFPGEDEAAWYRAMAIALAQIAAIYGMVGGVGIWLLILLLACGAVGILAERPPMRQSLRVALLGVIVLGAGYLMAQRQMHWRTWVIDTHGWIATHLIFGNMLLRTTGTAALAHIAGLLLCLKESNMIVRIMLAVVGIKVPKDDSTPPAAWWASQHDTVVQGAVIGNIERVLVFIFVLYGAFNAVAFIITAKGIVRFHELVKPEWAPYVLIGTLLSTLLAITFALLAMHVSP